MKNFVMLMVVLLVAGFSNASVLLYDDFDNASIDTGLWSAAAGFTESGTLISAPGGNFMSSVNNYEGNIYIGLRNIYDSRNAADYGTYTMGYTGYGNLLVRNDNQGGGILAVTGWYYPNWVSLTSISIGGGVTHDIDIAFEWVTEGLLLSLDDLATPGLDVQSLIASTSPYYIAPSSQQIWNNANQTNNATWDVDFIQVGVPEPATMFLLGVGGLLSLKKRRTTDN